MVTGARRSPRSRGTPRGPPTDRFLVDDPASEISAGRPAACLTGTAVPPTSRCVWLRRPTGVSRHPCRAGRRLTTCPSTTRQPELVSANRSRCSEQPEGRAPAFPEARARSGSPSHHQPKDPPLDFVPTHACGDYRFGSRRMAGSPGASRFAAAASSLSAPRAVTACPAARTTPETNRAELGDRDFAPPAVQTAHRIGARAQRSRPSRVVTAFLKVKDDRGASTAVRRSRPCDVIVPLLLLHSGQRPD